MQKIIQFFKLIRWPNLVFTLLTQVAFYYFIVKTVYGDDGNALRLTDFYFFLLALASILIAAAGYIINDYFDVNIDLINKPSKLIVSKSISKRRAILLHLILSFIGVAISFYISHQMNQRFWWLGFCNLAVVFILVLYSATFKKKLLIGNVLIALLTSWVVVVIVLSQFQLEYFINGNDDLNLYLERYSKLLRIGMLYAGFAFIITLMREVVKDMEDFVGDERNGCKTIPIVWGFQVSKIFVAIWTVLLVLLLLILQIYVLPYQWFSAIFYALVLIVVPLVFSLKVLIAAMGSLHYHTLSNLYKFIMLTGILSMVFFKIYA